MSLRSRKRRLQRRKVEQAAERAEIIRRWMQEHPVWIPDNPPERTYTCPGCKRGVVAKRIGESCSYVVEHPDEKVGKGDEGEGKCKYKGPIEPKLLGYRPPKEKKDAQPGPEASGAGGNPASPSLHQFNRGTSSEGSLRGHSSPASQA